MPPKPGRIIIDTNLWVSFLLKKDFKTIDVHIKAGNIILLFSKEVLEELLNVIDRPKFKKYFFENMAGQFCTCLTNTLNLLPFTAKFRYAVIRMMIFCYR